MAAAPPNDPGAQERETPELDAMVGAWLGPDPEDGFDRELDDDPRALRKAVDDDDPRRRLAAGTGQYDLQSRDMAHAAADMPLERIMTCKVVCVRPEMDAAEARARMCERDIGGLPVVDSWGRALGLVSRSDLDEHGITDQPGVKRVADVMMSMVFGLPPDASIGRAAALMAYEGIHRIVVLDRAGYVVGLVSVLDIARWLGWSAGLAVDREP